jgi:hypothetical protein
MLAAGACGIDDYFSFAAPASAFQSAIKEKKER